VIFKIKWELAHMEISNKSYFWQGEKIRLRETKITDWEIWRIEGTDSDGIRLLDV
jgi:maltoporin